MKFLIVAILVATLLPLVEVSRLEVFARFAKALDNPWVRNAIADPVVDLVAHGFGQASNEAITTLTEFRRGVADPLGRE